MPATVSLAAIMILPCKATHPTLKARREMVGHTAPTKIPPVKYLDRKWGTQESEAIVAKI